MTLPLATLAAAITSAGVSAPSYSDILTSLQMRFASIYGSDVYLGADTQDGQLLAIFAQAIYDSNQTAVAVYNQFSPATAQGNGLSSLVKINGLRRLIASNSQVSLLVGGTVGTVILNGVAGDTNGNSWKLPTSVTIPSAGSILVTASCSLPGSVSANSGTITKINTPTLGWSTVTNPSAASLGAPVESDFALRGRQALSVGLPALTTLASTLAAVESVVGVVEARAYENDTGAVDANGLPAHSIAIVVQGGDATQIATAISNKKTPGCYTYGSTLIPIVDSIGATHNIRFFIPTPAPIGVNITVKALNGYTASTGVLIQQAIVDYINALGIGQAVYISRLYLPAQLSGGALSSQFELQVLNIGLYPAAPGAVDLPIAFNAMATCILANVALTVV